MGVVLGGCWSRRLSPLSYDDGSCEVSFTKVTGCLWRGSRPVSASEIQLFKTVINLEVGWFEFFHGLWRREQYWCEGASVEWRCYAMSDWSRPEASQLRDIVVRIKEQRNLGAVLVHCAHGVDRTGMVCAAWRIIEDKWTVEAAVTEMLQMGFHNVPYFYWKSVLGEL